MQIEKQLSLAERSVIGWFVRSPVAGTVALLVLLLLGLWGGRFLRVQLFPPVSIPVITVRLPWPAANAQQVADGLVKPLENRLLAQNDIERLYAFSMDQMALLVIRYRHGVDMDRAYAELNQVLNGYASWPDGVDRPQVNQLAWLEPVASVLIQGDFRPDEIRQWLFSAERALLQLGVAQVDFRGAMDDEAIHIELPLAETARLGLSVAGLAQQLEQQLTDRAVGEVGVGASLRSLQGRSAPKTLSQLADLSVKTGDNQLVSLGDLAHIHRQFPTDQVRLEMNTVPIIEMVLYRNDSADVITLADTIMNWMQRARQTLPPGLTVLPYQEVWTFMADRIALLISNALSGLVLVVLLLWLFLGASAAFWVAVGIPLALLGSAFVLYMTGMSLNMITVFSYIMALGIIVDDAIVVAEETQSLQQLGYERSEAAMLGAYRMWHPVLASSVTTLVAVLPLFFITGTVGDFLLGIPWVVASVIVVSLFECFCVLPRHLSYSWSSATTELSRWRQQLVRWGQWWLAHCITPVIELVLAYRVAVLAMVGVFVVWTVALLSSGAVRWLFFPPFEQNAMYINVNFSEQASWTDKQQAMRQIEQAIWQANDDIQVAYGVSMVKQAVVMYHTKQAMNLVDSLALVQPQRHAAVTVELADLDQQRAALRRQFVESIQSHIIPHDQMREWEIITQRQSPAADGVTIQLLADDWYTLKQASDAVKLDLRDEPGVYSLVDDARYDGSVWQFVLNERALAMGLTQADVQGQLTAAFSGVVVDRIDQPYHDMAVRVVMPQSDRENIDALAYFPIVFGKEVLPLAALVDWQIGPGFAVIAHEDGMMRIEVSMQIDQQSGYRSQLIRRLNGTILPKLQQTYPVQWKIAGLESEQRAYAEVELGAVLGLLMIYLVLVWVFSSYLWPLAVFLVIPLAWAGAIWGHYIWQVDGSFYTLFGLFALTGIVVNDSIILVVRYRELLETMSTTAALVEAVRQRSRAVFLTSLTTIFGLMPLLLDSSATAQYFHPIVLTIIAGLVVSTGAILLVVPVGIALLEDARRCLSE